MSRMSVISNGKITYKLANILFIFGFLLIFFAYFTDEKFDGVEFFDFRINEMVIPPFLMGLSHRIHAAVFSFIAGVMPPMPMLGLSLL